MLLHHGQQFERHATGLLVARPPLLNCRFAGVQIPGEDGLADVRALVNTLDLLWRQNFRGRQT